jgi:hypothetical protein
MDPNATLEILLEAAFESDVDTFREAADNLAEWLSKKGFPPEARIAYKVALRVGFNPTT